MTNTGTLIADWSYSAGTVAMSAKAGLRSFGAVLSGSAIATSLGHSADLGLAPMRSSRSHKSRKGWVGDRDNSPVGAAIGRHEDALTRDIINDLKPDVAVLCGEKALHGLARG